MTRADLVASLAALVSRRAITPAQAAQLLNSFDAGDFLPSDLPPEPTRDDWLLALLLVLLLTGGNTTRPLSAAKRRQARNTLRGGFQATMGQLAVGVTTGALAVGAWQSAMQVNIAAYTRQMAVAGAGALPSGATQAAVEAQLAQQWPFLQTFAVQIAAKKAGGGGAGSGVLPVASAEQAAGMLSVAAIAARSRMYGNVGHAAFYQGQGDDPQYGYIERWVSLDDGKVCPNCARLHGEMFLPGDGVMPGSVCFGTCRCSRVLEYNEAEYIRLGGASAPRKAA